VARHSMGVSARATSRMTEAQDSSPPGGGGQPGAPNRVQCRFFFSRRRRGDPNRLRFVPTEPENCPCES
jgi:hypothetical protein